jgi:hypothetical protein
LRDAEMNESLKNYLNSNEPLKNFLNSMDRLQWLRMLVCFMPGLVLMKLATYQSGVPAVNIFATGVLIVGGAAFALWPRLRGLRRADDVIAEDDGGELVQTISLDQSGQEHAKMVSALFDLCDEQKSQAMLLVESEIAVDPKLTYGEAIERALQRRLYLADK